MKLSEERFQLRHRSNDGLWDWKSRPGQMYFRRASSNSLVDELEIGDRWTLLSRVHPKTSQRPTPHS